MSAFSERLQANAESLTIAWRPSQIELKLQDLTASGYLVSHLSLASYLSRKSCGLEHRSEHECEAALSGHIAASL